MRRSGSQGLFNNLRKKPSIAIGSIVIFLLVTLFLSWTNRKTIDDVEYEREAEIHKVANKWRFAIISDMDENSKVSTDEDTYWRSYFRKATLMRDPVTGEYSIKWDDNALELKNYLNEKGRALELSDLTRYNNRLYACDDRTGVVYEIIESKDTAKAVPRQILMDGDGNNNKGFKCEWGTVKDGIFYIGSFGKEYTDKEGNVVSENPMWVKALDSKLNIKHMKWSNVYSALRAATDTLHPGYLFHESCQWNRGLRRWFFLPRRLSKEKYDPKVDEQKGANVMISLNEDFENPKVVTVGTIKDPSHGFSAFRFIPGREDEVIALKTMEIGLEKIASYVMIFNTKGEVLMGETEIATGIKYEGLEFLKMDTTI